MHRNGCRLGARGPAIVHVQRMDCDRLSEPDRFSSSDTLHAYE